MSSWHQSLTEKISWYKRWHANPFISPFHWTVFLLLSMVFTNLIVGRINEIYGGGQVYADIALPIAFTVASDNIPDFTQDLNRTRVTAVKSGNWSDTSIWSTGALPQASQIVVVPTGTTVTYDNTTGVANTVGVHGNFKFRTDINTKLTVNNIEVFSDGYLEIGTSAAPVPTNVKSEIIFADNALNLTLDPDQWGNGLIGLGRISIHGAEEPNTFLGVSAEPLKGATTITLSQVPTGWKVGDRVFIPDTRTLQWNEQDQYYYSQSEERTIQAISGSTITLNSPLLYDHKGARDLATNAIKFLPHVGNLSRNIIFRSANPLGTRGHIAVAGAATVDISFTELNDLGRTTVDPIDPVANHIGRYSLHAHHLTTSANFVGNAIDGGSSVHRHRWAIAIHDTDNSLIKQNVIYNWAGAGIMLEEGDENDNVFDSNFIDRVVVGNGASRADGGQGNEGSGFWVRDGSDNYFRNNVVANGGLYGYTFFGGGPFYEFSGNVAYGGRRAWTAWDINGADTTRPNPNAPISYIKNFTAWNNWEGAIGLTYPMYNVTFDNINVLNNPAGSGAGFTFGDYEVHNIKLTNSNIQGMAWGVQIPVKNHLGGEEIFTVENTYLNNYYDVTDSTLGAPGGGGGSLLQPMTAILRNVKFGSYNPTNYFQNNDGTPNYPKDIYMYYWDVDSGNPVQKMSLYVYDYNQIPGNDFRVYFKEQNPNFIVPQTGSRDSLIGSPEAGLTNAQNWAKYGIAIAGSIAPCLDDTTHPEINGYVCPIDIAPPPPPPADTQAPTVSVSALPTTVSGTVNISAIASDNVGVASVRFRQNGATIGVEDTTSPFSVSWDTTQVPNGQYTLTAVAKDSAGNVAISDPVVVNVSNAISTPTTPTPSPSDLRTGMISYWDLDESSGTRADSYGSNNLADPTSVSSGIGKLGNAAKFVGGSSQNLIVSDNAGLSVGNQDFTIAGWVKLSSKTSLMGIVGKSTFGSIDEYGIGYTPSGDRFNFSLDGSIVSADALGSPSVGTWYYIMAWYDSSAHTVNIQINNGPVNSATDSNGTIDGPAAFSIGSYRANTQYFLDGYVDEVGFWKRVLSSSERSELYNSGNGLSFAGTGSSNNSTPSPSSPNISNVVSRITRGTVSFSWNTDIPSNSQLDYGLSTTYGSHLSDATLTTNHQLSLSNLSPGTYHFQVSSTANNQTANSTDQTFTIRPKPLAPTNITVSPGSIILNWTNPTFDGFSGTAIIRSTTGYVLTYDPNQQIATTDLATYHDEAVTPGTKYYYSLFAYDDQGNYSDPATVSYVAPASSSSSSGSNTSTNTVHKSSGGGGGGGGGAKTASVSSSNRVITTDFINVRASASVTGTILKKEPGAVGGTILSGPVASGGYTWYQIKYDDGITGWSVQNWLRIIKAQTTSTTQTSTNTTTLTDDQKQTLIKAIQAQLIILIKQLNDLLAKQGAMVLQAIHLLFPRKI